MKSIITVSLASDAGCLMALVGLHRRLFNMLSDASLAFSPLLVDAKEIPEKVDVALIEGSIRTARDERLAKEVRSKSKIVIAMGSCACFGGVQSLCNIVTADELMTYVYKGTESTVGEAIPREEVPELLPHVKSVDEVITVDFKVPGCPPESEEIAEVVEALLKGERPELPGKSVCSECEREREGKLVGAIRRLFKKPDPERCLLEQGYICMGPVTRAGCKAKCPMANVPCDGCRGPTEMVDDQGVALLDGLTALAYDRVKDYSVRSHSAMFHRYTFATSDFAKLIMLIKRRRQDRQSGKYE